MSLNPKSWLHIFPVVKATGTRFLLPVLFVVILTVISLLLVHKVEFLDKGLMFIMYAVLGMAIVAQVAVKLYVESVGLSAKKYIIVSILVFVVVVFYTVSLFDKTSFISFFSLSLALLLSLMFSAYITRKSSELSVWYFNYQTGVAIFFASLSAIVFGAGLSLVVVSVEYLFDMKMPGIIYADIWIVAWMLLAVVYIMANISKEFDFDEEGCEFPKGVSFIANYILAPLMLVYVAVLYAYFIKILLQWELPKGNIGWMVSGFGVIGVVTKLLSFPIRDKGTRLMLLIDKYFYMALVVPVLMLFIAIIVRISDYGVTEQRYAVCLLGVWLVFLISASIILNERFHIKYVPMSLAVLALLASLGPWSAADVSFNSQMSRFEKILLKNNLLVNGQAISSSIPVSFDDRKDMSSIADYFGKVEWRSNKAREIFKNILEKEENKWVNDLKKITGTEFIALLKFDHVSKWDRKRNSNAFIYVNYNYPNVLSNSFFDVSGFRWVTRDTLYSSSGIDRDKVILTGGSENGEKIKVSLSENKFIIRDENKSKIEVDLTGFIRSLQDKGIKKINSTNASEMIINKTSPNGRLKARIVFEKISAKIKKGDYKLTNIRYLLMLNINEK